LLSYYCKSTYQYKQVRRFFFNISLGNIREYKLADISEVMFVFKLLLFFLYYRLGLCGAEDPQDRLFNLVAQHRTHAHTPFASFTVNGEERCLSLCSHEEKCKSYDVLVLSIQKTECRLFDFTFAYHRVNQTSEFENKPGIVLFSKYYFKHNCLDWYNKEGARSNGVYEVFLSKDIQRLVYCYMEGEGGGWMAFQRRFDGTVDFVRNWNDYKKGFGDGSGEYWLGNDVLHELTSLRTHDLFVIATDFSGVSQTKRFSGFTIGSEQQIYTFDYVSVLPGYSSHQLFLIQKGGQFSTIDRDNDMTPTYDCAQLYHGGWWYKECHHDLMNGKYFHTEDCDRGEGIHWRTWQGNDHEKCLKKTLLMIKPTV